jgi:uncharacterized protein (DUF1697 family)
MPRYAAFLRGVMPTNAKMPDLKRAFEAAGFSDVRTVLGSGNVVFTARSAPAATLERKAETAMTHLLGRSFFTIVRSLAELEALLATDPYRGTRLPKEAKRNVTFLRAEPKSKLTPAAADGTWLVGMKGREVFTAHIPNNPRGAVFMVMIQKALGTEQTTRTWQTVERVVRAGA